MVMFCNEQYAEMIVMNEQLNKSMRQISLGRTDKCESSSKLKENYTRYHHYIK